MEEQFELKLSNRTKSGWLIILGAFLLTVAIDFVGTNLIHGDEWQFLWCLAVAFGSGYSAFRLLKKRMVYPALVSVESDQLTVQNLANTEANAVLFTKVASYRYMVTKGVHWLIFKMFDGTKLKISANTNFGEIGNFTGMVKSLEQSAAQFRMQNSTAMLPDRSFF
ncbi:hypothetical protein [Hymenobacter sp. PAMC 26628]|uniref:hypothetical protein n=1 Tax=Hymenobacter sp. PAMC 26628 TaxID=1484118 RepID=UPI000AD2DD7B|nr:hypothetical protein [Hymenobacter sp. PAMC 26628]